MPKKKMTVASVDPVPALIKKMMIIQMGLAGVGQHEIRKIVGCSLNDVNHIVKLLKKVRSSN